MNLAEGLMVAATTTGLVFFAAGGLLAGATAVTYALERAVVAFGVSAAVASYAGHRAWLWTLLLRKGESPMPGCIACGSSADHQKQLANLRAWHSLEKRERREQWNRAVRLRDALDNVLCRFGDPEPHRQHDIDAIASARLALAADQAYYLGDQDPAGPQWWPSPEGGGKLAPGAPEAQP